MTWTAQLPLTSRDDRGDDGEDADGEQHDGDDAGGDRTAVAAAQAGRPCVGAAHRSVSFRVAVVGAGDAEERDVDVEAVDLDPGQLAHAADDVVAQLAGGPADRARVGDARP